MIEPLLGMKWIYATLSADATLTGLVSTRIYDGLAPQGGALPYVVYNHMGGADLLGIGAIRVFANGLYQVKAVCKGNSYAPAKAIADQVDELLHGASGATTDGVVLACVREQPLALIEQQDGIEYRHVGGIYRLFVQQEA